MQLALDLASLMALNDCLSCWLSLWMQASARAELLAIGHLEGKAQQLLEDLQARGQAA